MLSWPNWLGHSSDTRKVNSSSLLPSTVCTARKVQLDGSVHTGSNSLAYSKGSGGKVVNTSAFLAEDQGSIPCRNAKNI